MLTKSLIAINVLIFAYMYFTGAYTSDPSLINYGALYGPAVDHGQWWRAFTAAFVHANILHIATNMFALYQVGSFVEVIFGRTRYIIIYLLAILGSAYAVYHFSYAIPTIGASGAIFGLFGAMLAAGLRMGERGRYLVQQTVPIIVINLVLGFTLLSGIVSNAGHIGGLISGVFAGYVLFMIPRRTAVAYDPNEPIEGEIVDAPHA